MAKVKNALRQPLDIELNSKEGKRNKVLNLGPRETSRNLTAQEMESPQVQANLNNGNLVLIQEPAKKSSTKEGDK